MFILLVTLLFIFNLHAVDSTPYGTSCQQLLHTNHIPTRAGQTQRFNATRPTARGAAHDKMNFGVLAASLSCAALVGGYIGHTVLPSTSEFFNTSDISGARTAIGVIIGMKTVIFLATQPSIARSVNAMYEACIRRFEAQADRFLD